MARLFIRKLMPLLAAALVITACGKEEGFFRLEPSLQNHSFSCIGGEASVPVNTNTSFTAKVTGGEDWIHLIIPGMSVTVVVDPMEGAEDRTGTFDIITGAGTKTITVVQKAITWNDVPESVSLNNNTLSFSATVTSSVPVKFDLPDWLSVSEERWQAGQHTYTFTAGVYLDPNEPSRLATVTASAAGQSRSINVEQTSFANAAVQCIAQLWDTDPMGLPSTASERYGLLAKIEDYCKECDRPVFRDTYLLADDATAAAMEQEYSILSIYRYVFDKVLEEVKTARVENGTTRIWMIYNCGFIFKTPSKCWGMDINHRYAYLLEPYLDFITVSHSDGDHIDTPLMNAMAAAGKPVVSNFFAASSAYRSARASTYKIGNVTLSTAITDENDSEPDCMTVFRVNTGADGGNLEFVHIGDSDCKPAQFFPVEGKVDMAIMRGISTGYEVRILGAGSGQIDPDYILLAHQQELRHYISKSPMRATILGCLNSGRYQYGTYSSKISLPFWGTALVWDGSALKKYE